MWRASALRPTRVVALVLVLALAGAAPAALPQYWIFLSTSAVIWGILALSVGVITGRAGMISLCQLSFAAIGGWAVVWFAVHLPSLPFGLQLIGGALAAAAIGSVVGLPALRLRGVHLAVVTLGVAVAITTIFTVRDFPGAADFVSVARPTAIAQDSAFYLLCWGVFLALATLLWLIDRSRLGSSWLVLRDNERATASLGLDVARTKLGAFAISAAVGGLAGGLFAAQHGLLTVDYFRPLDSLVVFAVGVAVAARRPEGALLGGVLVVFVPELLRRVGLPQDLGPLLFATGAIVALRRGAGVAELWHRRPRPTLATRQLSVARISETTPDGRRRHDGHALVLGDLTVRYGSVVALDAVTWRAGFGVTGLIGPNGAGKTTLVDAVTGFVPGASGSIELSGRRIDRLPAYRRARSGLRRTFQQGRATPTLTVGRYVGLAAGRRLDASELATLLELVGAPAAEQPIGTLDVGSRRLVEIAGALAARPAVLLLDEPAAGLWGDDALRLAECVVEMPRRYGCAVIVIEHDLDVVRSACDELVALDFGRVIAAGAVDEVLATSAVVAAYLGADSTAAPLPTPERLP